MGTHDGHKRQAYADTTALLKNTLFSALADNAERFTCSEIEALAEIYRLHGLAADAEMLIEYHAEEDDEGDEHYQGEEES